MYKYITPEYKEVLEMYLQGEAFPEFLVPFLEAKSLQRLTGISQSCGTHIPQFAKYNFTINRLDHSIGVALIVWHFTKDKAQTLAGLFHDISHSVFSHVGDFLLGDAENQESSEQFTTTILKNDPVIMRELEKLGILLDQVDDYTLYPIADNHGPQLAADRLEYTLGTPITQGTDTFKNIERFFANNVVLKNEAGEEEIGFTDRQLAEEFALLSVRNDRGYYSSYESTVSQSFLAEMLRKTLDANLTTYEDLYALKEEDIINIITNSNNQELQNMWTFFQSAESYEVNDTKPQTNKFTTSSKSKIRRIDPLVQTEDTTSPQRVSHFSQTFVQERDANKNKPEKWLTLDHIM